MEQFKAMIKSMEKDRAFFEEFGRLLYDADDAAILMLVKEKGFNITGEDLNSYKDFISKAETDMKNSQKLDEEDLEGVAGGNTDMPDGRRRIHCMSHLPGKAEYRNGAERKQCKAWSCWIPIKAPWGTTGYCNCYETSWCVDCWHKVGSCYY